MIIEDDFILFHESASKKSARRDAERSHGRRNGLGWGWGRFESKVCVVVIVVIVVILFAGEVCAIRWSVLLA